MIIPRQLKQNRDLQKEDQNSLYKTIKGYIPSSSLAAKNKARSWIYGYSKKYNLVVISKTGQVGDIINVNGLHIALPLEPDVVIKRSEASADQYWERELFPKELSKISSIFKWNDYANSI